MQERSSRRSVNCFHCSICLTGCRNIWAWCIVIIVTYRQAIARDGHSQLSLSAVLCAAHNLRAAVVRHRRGSSDIISERQTDRERERERERRLVRCVCDSVDERLLRVCLSDAKASDDAHDDIAFSSPRCCCCCCCCWDGDCPRRWIVPRPRA